MDLIDTHHRSVVRGFVMDDSVFPRTSPVEALLPYLGKGKPAATDAATAQPRNVEEDGTAAHGPPPSRTTDPA